MNPAEFTIGWICALQIELVAAQGMLEQEYDARELQKTSPDTNQYCLGKIGGHKIVLPCLISLGNNEIGRAVSQMRHTFQNLDSILMVGIGGGIPALVKGQDVRLGDVVVSMPSGLYGGIIQYDTGEFLENKSRITGALQSPPLHLQKVVRYLTALHEAQENCIARYVQEMLERKPYYTRPETDYRRPSSENDLLFKAESIHVGRSPSCINCDKEQLVARHDRDKEKSQIHYGNIILSNSVIRDAKKRDDLGKEYGALCVETEPALPDEFAYLAIRGISDYSDSHKNQDWQRYAAAAAAAYGKELLNAMRPKETQNESRNYSEPLYSQKNVSTGPPIKFESHMRSKDIEDSGEKIGPVQDQRNETRSRDTGLYIHNSEVRKETLGEGTKGKSHIRWQVDKDSDEEIRFTQDQRNEPKSIDTGLDVDLFLESTKDRFLDFMGSIPFKKVYEEMRSKWSEYMEPLLEDNKTRIRWTCQCGERLWDDFIELRPGAANALQYELDFHARASAKTASNLDAPESTANTAPNSDASRTPSAIASSRTGASAPITSPTVELSGLGSGGAANEPSMSDQDSETKFLLLCFSKMNDTCRLLQLNMEGITDDFKLFHLLREFYINHRGTLNRAFRTIVSINAIKLELHPWERVVILSNPNGQELPFHENPDACHPTHLPKCDTSYDLRPTPPDLDPFMGRNDLAHLLKCPHEARHQGNNLRPRTVWLNRFPKKRNTKLEECPPYQYGLGWGIELEEGWHGTWLLRFEKSAIETNHAHSDSATVGWLLKVLIMIFVLAATVFWICWWKFTGDIQGATGLATALISYPMLLLAAFAAVMAVDVKKF